MKRISNNQESIERLTANKISDKQLLMVKGGGNNPPNPGTGTEQDPQPGIPSPSNPGSL